MSFIYWIKFDSSKPIRIVAKDMLELMDIINTEITKHQMPFEWLIRDYK